MNKLVFTLIFLTLLLSDLESSIICVEGKRINSQSFELEFRHSIHGGKIALYASVRDGKILIEKMISDDEASISYYTSQYSREDGKFVAILNEEVGEMLVNEGWKLKAKGYEFETNRLTRILVCR
ncbi:MAG: hypothetical protein QXR27_01685 [Archaeoglobaceae archaeon]